MAAAAMNSATTAAPPPTMLPLRNSLRRALVAACLYTMQLPKRLGSCVKALEAKRAAAATPSAAEWEPPRGAGRSPRGNGRAAEYDANARAAARAKARAGAARPAERVPIQLPDGVVPNQKYRATLDDGSDVMFTAPADARAGQVIELELMPASTRSRAS